MGIKERIIVVSGNELGAYRVKLWTYVKIQGIRLYLWCVRWLRRIARGLGYCKYAFMVVPFWAVYVVAVHYWGFFRLGSYPIMDILWDIKSSVFTSVILSAATSFITQYHKQKYVFHQQHNAYTTVMEKASRLYKDLVSLVCDSDVREQVPFWPFYTQDMRRSALDSFKFVADVDKSSVKFTYVMKSIDELRREIENLERNIYNGCFAECSIQSVQFELERCYDELINLERLLELDTLYQPWQRFLSSYSYAFYNLLERLRKPWRKDIKYKMKVLNMIYAEDKNIAQTFYNSAFLNVVNYEAYAQLNLFIDKLKKEEKELANV